MQTVNQALSTSKISGKLIQVIKLPMPIHAALTDLAYEVWGPKVTDSYSRGINFSGSYRYRCQSEIIPGKKECAPPPWHPSFLGLSPDPEVTEQKKTMVQTIILGKQWKRVYTLGPERRVYTIEASSPE